ncbi:hypothetical protein HUJ05_001790 [Dendroctonus ponderosae]|nr:hypothetical protein HUJ05_001790 [Dendroctonus ponderosae]
MVKGKNTVSHQNIFKRHQEAKARALKSIIEDIHLTILVDNLKVKIKNIRTTYNRETAKLANLRKDWCGYR